MLAFLDFEASSLAKRSYPIEVAWMFEDGIGEAHLIHPAAGWEDWSGDAQAIHGIARERLLREGTAHDAVAARMVEVLAGHDLLASAPSWDGKWLSTLLRAAGLPRHTLRLRDSEEACRERAAAILTPVLPPDRVTPVVAEILAEAKRRKAAKKPAHRALADAVAERETWCVVRDLAVARALSAAQGLDVSATGAPARR